MAEAEQLNIGDVVQVEARNTWAFQPIGGSVEWLLPAQFPTLGADSKAAR
jgi:hypothetical protein